MELPIILIFIESDFLLCLHLYDFFIWGFETIKEQVEKFGWYWVMRFNFTDVGDNNELDVPSNDILLEFS